MPRYYFDLNTGGGILRDPDGTEFADEAAARAHARRVAGELMRNRERTTGTWRVIARDDDGTACFELLFHSLDHAMAHLAPEIRSSVEDLWRQTAQLNDAIREIRTTLRQVTGTIAQASRAPYVAAIDGVCL